MLVLTRRLGEQIVIDGTVRVTIVALRGDRVRIGVTAPPRITVNRQEVQDRPARGGRRKTPTDPAKPTG